MITFVAKNPNHFFIIVLLITFFAVSGQTSDVCYHDCSKFGDSKDSVHATSQTSSHSDASSPMDCGCATHTHGCCSHFSMLLARNTSTFVKFSVSTTYLSAYLANIIPAPYIDGPFQPPKV
jgi:hypothetical protein